MNLLDVLIWRRLRDGGGGGGGGAATLAAVLALGNDANGARIVGLAAPVGAGDAATKGYIDAELHPFAISSFTMAVTSREVGQSLPTPAFTAAYSSAPTTATLTDSEGGSKDVSATPTAFSSNGTFSRSVPSQTAVFTLNATQTGAPAPAPLTRTATWLARRMYGAAIDPGSYTGAFVNGLATQALSASKTGSFAVAPSAGQSVFFAVLSSFSLVQTDFTVSGLPFGISKVGDPIAVTNGFGVTLNYQLWRSDNTGLGSLTFVVA